MGASDDVAILMATAEETSETSMSRDCRICDIVQKYPLTMMCIDVLSWLVCGILSNVKVAVTARRRNKISIEKAGMTVAYRLMHLKYAWPLIYLIRYLNAALAVYPIFLSRNLDSAMKARRGAARLIALGARRQRRGAYRAESGSIL